MRIIAGTARSRRIAGPPGKATRPMTDRMRESLFSSIAALLPESRVLDLYAGSGALGLEALSRGAAEVVFVEQDRAALRVLRSNVDSIGLGGEIAADDVDRFLERSRGGFDLAFVDPPYALPLASLLETLNKLSRRLVPGGTAIVHRRYGAEPPAVLAEFRLVEQRKYGGAVLWRYEKEHP
jgi:16S rRNA (guanine966-N2)-methyltransferase